VFLLASPIPAPVGPIVLPAPECPQACYRLISHCHHIAAVATVTTIRATKGDKLFVAKADRAAAAITRINRYLSSINHYFSALLTNC
jgi:hypothetical protein